MSPLRIFLLAVVITATYADDVSIETKAGVFVGFSDEIVTFHGEAFRISKFLGIPYAEPPVGDLRFQKPVPKGPLTEPLETKRFRNPCLQAMLLPKPPKGSEDCLYLNVYVPSVIPEGERLPVMLWIHGGGFVLGSASTYVPDRLVANGPVIVVTTNYRLSVWGFLNTGDSNSPGNYGLWDQHLAIQWVHNNIEDFGGDPNRVTIFGESSGSASVVYQGLYRGNRGLFQRIIGQSGSPTSAWPDARRVGQDAKDFAELAGCETSDTTAMMVCLRGLPSDVINATLNNLTNGLAVRPMIFVPYLDYHFIEEKPDDIFNQNLQVAEASRSTLASFDIMVGSNSGEGYLMTPPSPWDREGQNNFLPNRTYFEDTLIPQFLSICFGEAPAALKQAVVAEYTAWDDPENPKAIRDQYIDLAGDVFFVEPTCRTVDLHARYSERPSSYMYYFTLLPSNHVSPTPSWAYKPTHGDEIIFVFGGEGDLSEFGVTEKLELQDWEKAASQDIMTLWTNFAKTGNPNKPRDLGLDWLPYTQKHRHYIDIGRTMSSRNVKTRLKDRKMNFWSKVAPAIRDACKAESSSNKDGTCSKEKDCSP